MSIERNFFCDRCSASGVYFKLVYGVVRYLDLDCGRTNLIGKRSMIEGRYSDAGRYRDVVERRCSLAKFRDIVISDIPRKRRQRITTSIVDYIGVSIPCFHSQRVTVSSLSQLS